MNKTFTIEPAVAGDMMRFRQVDWDAVVDNAIRTKLKVMRQSSTTGVPLKYVQPVEVQPVAPFPTAPVVKPKPAAMPKHPRPLTLSPEEIRQRVASRRAAASRSTMMPAGG